MATTGPGKHRHLANGKWTTDKDPDHVHTFTETAYPADKLTEAEVISLRALIAGGGTGTTPVPNPPPGPTPDITAPIISGVAITVTGQTSATVTLATNEASTVRLRYGTSTAYGTTTAYTASGTSHSFSLTGLDPITTYHLVAEALDAAGNLGLSGDRTFTTAAPLGSPTPVTSVAALITALQNSTIREIVLANGTYSMGYQDINGALSPGYIRTAATSVVVRAETDGGVTLDLGGSGSPHIMFRGGAAYQEWRGFKFANSHPGDNGVVMFGEGNGTAVHHLTLRNIEFLSSISAGPGPNGNYQNGQGLYFSWATGGNHDILVDGFVSAAALWSQVHVYHDSPSTGSNITVRNATWTLARQTHAQMGIVAWSTTMSGYLFEDIAVSGANEYGFRHAAGGTMTLRRVTTTNSGVAGFYSSLGTYPTVTGLTFA